MREAQRRHLTQPGYSERIASSVIRLSLEGWKMGNQYPSKAQVYVCSEEGMGEAEDTVKRKNWNILGWPNVHLDF